MTPPRYREAYRNGGQGEVLLLVKVARDGTVADGRRAGEHGCGRVRATLAKMRDILARASVSTARTWTFAADHRRGQHPGQLDGSHPGELRPEP